jgi:hypothetical protein
MERKTYREARAIVREQQLNVALTLDDVHACIRSGDLPEAARCAIRLHEHTALLMRAIEWCRCGLIAGDRAAQRAE